LQHDELNLTAGRINDNVLHLAKAFTSLVPQTGVHQFAHANSLASLR
jgi:hypothetical protein